jgi:hypothetical protein
MLRELPTRTQSVLAAEMYLLSEVGGVEPHEECSSLHTHPPSTYAGV